MRGAARTVFVAATMLAGGCGDEIVGFIPAELGAADSSSSDAPMPATTEAFGTTGVTGTGTGTGGPGFVGPGCFGDDFEDGVIGAMWSPWVEPDASISEGAGMLKMTPPTSGVWDTGVVGSHEHDFPFITGHLRMRVPVPPAEGSPVVLFLQVGDETGTSLSIQLSGGQVIVVGAVDLVDVYREEFVVAAYPQWIGIRAEGDVVHFETSDDGVVFTPVTTQDKLADFAVGSVLVMTQTYGVYPDPEMVAVDDLEVCVE